MLLLRSSIDFEIDCRLFRSLLSARCSARSAEAMVGRSHCEMGLLGYVRLRCFRSERAHLHAEGQHISTTRWRESCSGGVPGCHDVMTHHDLASLNYHQKTYLRMPELRSLSICRIEKKLREYTREKHKQSMHNGVETRPQLIFASVE